MCAMANRNFVVLLCCLFGREIARVRHRERATARIKFIQSEKCWIVCFFLSSVDLLWCAVRQPLCIFSPRHRQHSRLDDTIHIALRSSPSLSHSPPCVYCVAFCVCCVCVCFFVHSSRLFTLRFHSLSLSLVHFPIGCSPLARRFQITFSLFEFDSLFVFMLRIRCSRKLYNSIYFFSLCLNH